jgi:hypothetical protein
VRVPARLLADLCCRHGSLLLLSLCLPHRYQGTTM